MEENNMRLSCVDCGKISCKKQDGQYPAFCDTASLTQEEIDELARLYMDPENNRIAKASAEIEGSFYGKYTRLEETVEFARRIGAKKLGIATCVGLLEESRILAKILRLNGFEVFSAACKTASMTKTETLGLDPKYTSIGNVMCNPIQQARLMNKEQVDLVILMGLCVGHDSLFYKYCERTVTTLVVKDRVLGNNPVQALYLTRSYYRRLLESPVGANGRNATDRSI